MFCVITKTSLNEENLSFSRSRYAQFAVWIERRRPLWLEIEKWFIHNKKKTVYFKDMNDQTDFSNQTKETAYNQEVIFSIFFNLYNVRLHSVGRQN